MRKLGKSTSWRTKSRCKPRKKCYGAIFHLDGEGSYFDEVSAQQRAKEFYIHMTARENGDIDHQTWKVDEMSEDTNGNGRAVRAQTARYFGEACLQVQGPVDLMRAAQREYGNAFDEDIFVISQSFRFITRNLSSL